MAERTGQAQGRHRGRVIVTTALVAIGVLVILIFVGTNLTPSANAVLALVVFGGMLGAFLLVQRRVGTREPLVVEEAIATEESEL
jgi:protein-S-isoprenylcysteine O-methyltransferase Ste14